MALDARESTWICQRMVDHGCQLHAAQEILALEGDADGNLTAVRTEQGDHAVDVAVVAIGVVPNTGWLAGSAIDLAEGGGILVDEALRTSAPDVFAAGDCASVLWPDGSRRPEQLWYTAPYWRRQLLLRNLRDPHLLQ
jgi:NADPH-dependent 2,4-dienoyl-CoA reductase/sulfur reductase-like enzyme